MSAKRPTELRIHVSDSSQLPTMPVHNCPHSDCVFATADVSDNLADTLLQIHANGAHPRVTNPQSNPPPPATPAVATTASTKTEKVRRPTISMGGSTEYWSYFLIRWSDYKEATGIRGRELIIQLFGCSDEDLLKDLTRYAGRILTDQTREKVLEKINTLAIRN